MIQYGSLKTDLPGTPLKKGSRGWDKKALKVPLAFGGCEGDLRGINSVKPSVLGYDTYLPQSKNQNNLYCQDLAHKILSFQ